MVPLSLNDVKNIELQILTVFDAFCRNNGLRYSLAYGSLIGAVRHHGFIPWDDDVDIWMPRPDYNAFVNSFTDDRYLFLCHEKSDYWQEFGKITDVLTFAEPTNNKGMGVFIDVFPVDGLPQKRVIYYKKKLLRQFNIYKRMRSATIWKCDKSPISLVFKLIDVLHPTKKVFQRFENNKQRHSFNDSVFSWDLYTQFESSDFDNLIELEFEGKKFFSLANYHKYLRDYYGDYMQYAPLQKRTTGHNYKFYLADINTADISDL